MCGSSVPSRPLKTHYFCRPSWILLRNCALLVLPMVTLSFVLLGLVIYYQWHRHHAPISGLELSREFSATVFFVDISATRLILVASLSSSIVFALMGSVMTLLSFPLAAEMMRNSRGAYLDMLPTPDQLAVFIDLLDGKRGTLWRWLTGIWQRRKTQIHSVWALEVSAGVSIFLTIMSLTIISANIWLHVSTKSLPMPYFADVSPTAYRFSRALMKNCRNADQDSSSSNFTLPCSVSSTGTALKTLRPETINSMLLNNIGSSNTIHRDTATGLSFIGEPSRMSMSFGGGNSVVSPRFNATTFAMKTTCSLVRDCAPRLDSYGNGSFTCDPSFSRDAPSAWFGLTSWENPRDLFDTRLWLKYAHWTVYAPYPWFQIEPVARRLIVDSEIRPIEGSSALVLKCAPTLYDITYTWENDTLTKILDLSTANETLWNILLGPFLSDYPYNDDHMKSFATRMEIGTGAGNYPMEYYTEKYATLLSEIGLSFLGGAIEARPAIGLQVQNETTVTQVPKAPLFVLIFSNLWYAFIGFCAFLAACSTTACGGKHVDVRAVQELFTIGGLTKAAVNKTRSSQGDNLRIGVEKVEDGWRFKVWDRNEDIEDIGSSAMGPKPCSPNLTASKGPPLVQVVSLDSSRSQEAVEDYLLELRDTGLWQISAAAPADDGSVSLLTPVAGSISNDKDKTRPVSQSSFWAGRSSGDGDDYSDIPASENLNTSPSPQRSLSSPISVDGHSTDGDLPRIEPK